MRQEIFQHSITYLQDQFKILFNSILEIDKKGAESLNTEIYQLKVLRDNLKDQIAEQRIFITALQTERDTFRDETRDLNQIKT